MLAALVAACAVSFAPVAAQAQDDLPACSNGIDDDSDGAIDGADAGCADGKDDDETDSIYSGIVYVTVPLPLVTLQGTVDRKNGVKVKRLQIRALRGSVVKVVCRGRSCPYKRTQTRMLRSSFRLSALERKLKAPTTLTLRVAQRSKVGKFVRYKLRRKRAPERIDGCIGEDGKRKPCYED